VHFVCARSISCSSTMSSRRCRCWRPRRQRSGRVAYWRAVRTGFVVSCRVLPMAGRRGGQPCRLRRALSMDRVHQVMTFCETATWAHCSSVAHLVSLHSSYSHRTPREGVRSPSGSALAFLTTNQSVCVCSPTCYACPSFPALPVLPFLLCLSSLPAMLVLHSILSS
jgi:hypothetical protein